MTNSQIRQAQHVVDNCAKAGIPFDVMVLMLARWMKQRGLPVTTAHLEAATAHLNV